MSIALPTGRRGQIYAVGALVVLLLMLWLGVVAPLLGWYAARTDAIARQRMVTEHLATLVARLPALEAQARREAGHSPDIEGATDARAGADLQQQLEAMAAQAGAHLSRVEFLQTEPAEGYRRIQLRIDVTDRYPVLIGLLSAIEQASPPLFVDDLHLRAAGSEGDPTPHAEMTFVVVMLRAAPAPTPRTPT
jgi:general secretion pathway protein M